MRATTSSRKTGAIERKREIFRYLKIGRFASNKGVQAKRIIGRGPIG